MTNDAIRGGAAQSYVNTAMSLIQGLEGRMGFKVLSEEVPWLPGSAALAFAAQISPASDGGLADRRLSYRRHSTRCSGPSPANGQVRNVESWLCRHVYVSVETRRREVDSFPQSTSLTRSSAAQTTRRYGSHLSESSRLLWPCVVGEGVPFLSSRFD